jgi:uncharacterized membrane protein HdeD (DUF308 family)
VKQQQTKVSFAVRRPGKNAQLLIFVLITLFFQMQWILKIPISTQHDNQMNNGRKTYVFEDPIV